MIAIVVVAVVLVVLALAASVSAPLSPRTLVGSGHFVTNEENFTGFTAVTVASGFRFTITQSSSYSVKVTIDDNLVSYVQVSKSGNTLSVGLPTEGYSFQSVLQSVEITMPDITQLDISGGTSGTVTGFALSHDFTVTASGGSRVSMSGAARDLSIEASGGGRLDLSGLSVTNAQVDLNGGSQATINLNGRLDATLSGGSQLYYIGNPTLGNINTSGGSIISKR